MTIRATAPCVDCGQFVSRANVDSLPGHPDYLPCPEASDKRGHRLPRAIYDRMGTAIVGSGFASEDTICPECGRDIEKGWEAWVTAWDDPNRTAYHPSCYPVWEGANR